MMQQHTATLWTVLAAITVGCATPIEFSPPSMELREQLGVVRLSCRQDHTSRSIEAPIEGKDQRAASGASDGARTVMGWGHKMCIETLKDDLPISMISPVHLLACAGWEVLGVALTPIGAAVGATVGAIRSHSAEEALSAQRSLQFAIADAEPTETLIGLIEEESHQHGMAVHADCTQPFLPLDGYSLLCKDGIDTALVVAVIFDVLMEGESDPTLEVFTEATAKLVRTCDSRPLYERRWIYRSEKRSYFDFAEERGDPLRAEIRQSLERLAERIVSDLFVSTEIETTRSPVPGKVFTVDAWQHPEFELAE